MQLWTSHSDFANNDQQDKRLTAVYPCHYIFCQSAIFIDLRLFLFSPSCFVLHGLSLSLYSMRHPGRLDFYSSISAACVRKKINDRHQNFGATSYSRNVAYSATTLHRLMMTFRFGLPDTELCNDFPSATDCFKTIAAAAMS